MKLMFNITLLALSCRPIHLPPEICQFVHLQCLTSKKSTSKAFLNIKWQIKAKSFNLIFSFFSLFYKKKLQHQQLSVGNDTFLLAPNSKTSTPPWWGWRWIWKWWKYKEWGQGASHQVKTFNSEIKLNLKLKLNQVIPK
jgi:hypothetical protein